MKNKLFSIIALLMILIFCNFSFAYYCYQESANVTNQTGIDTVNCSLNYGGTYYDPNTGFDWWYGNKENVVDGNWSSSGSTAYGGGSTMIVTYLKPAYSLNSENLWQIKDGNATLNFTIPTDCLNYNVSSISVKYYLINYDGFSDYWAWWGCQNETANFKQLRYNTASNTIYEEAIIWNTTATGNINISFAYLNLILNKNILGVYNYTANYSYSFGNLTNRWWFVNGTNVLNDTDTINKTYLNGFDGTTIIFLMQLQNLDGQYYNFSISTTIPTLTGVGVNLVNQSATVIETGYTTNDTNLSVYDYLNLQLSVQTENASINNSQVWYQWFLDSTEYVKGWGVNVANFFFKHNDVGIHRVDVNASTSNETNATYGNVLSWYPINVTEPTLEPTTLEPNTGDEILDSINILCRHEFTGHNWLYDIDVYINNKTGSKQWLNVTNNPVPKVNTYFDLIDYADFDDNVSVRCRTYNEHFGYSNYTYNYGIVKKSFNDVKLFRPIFSTIFIGQLTMFNTICDMSKNNKYQILYHFVDVNGDGSYDKLASYSNTSNTNMSSFVFDTQFIISGKQQIVIGCIIQKKDTTTWDFNYCNEDQTQCTVQNTYNIVVAE